MFAINKENQIYTVEIECFVTQFQQSLSFVIYLLKVNNRNT